MKKKKNFLFLTKKCDVSRWSWQQREVGCPLDHCVCGTHDVENKHHECMFPDDEDEDIRHAEMLAGWDPNP